MTTCDVAIAVLFYLVGSFCLTDFIQESNVQFETGCDGLQKHSYGLEKQWK